MLRSLTTAVALCAILAACAAPMNVPVDADGRPLPQVYKIRATDSSNIQFRMLDSVNALRQASGAAPVELNSALTSAAATHSRDMSRQARPWNFGSDGSSPLERARRAGYGGRMLGEAISESYETELETLGGWMESPDARRILLDKRARDMGFSWHQERNGKIWWTLVMGG